MGGSPWPGAEAPAPKGEEGEAYEIADSRAKGISRPVSVVSEVVDAVVDAEPVSPAVGFAESLRAAGSLAELAGVARSIKGAPLDGPEREFLLALYQERARALKPPPPPVVAEQDAEPAREPGMEG